jgi:predicted dinucleotide-binding enzyme
VALPRDAVKGAEVVVLAVPAAAADAVIQELGGAIDGAIVIDATNPIGPGIRLLTGADGASHAEQMAKRLATTAPRAKLVKSFNQTGANVVEDIARFPGPPVMFAAGDDAESRSVVAKLAADLGFEPIEAGPLVRARELERLAALWIALSATHTTSLGRNFAFSLARGS